MTMIQIDSKELQGILTKSAAFVGAASPKLEKLDSLEKELTVLAKEAASAMATVGLIKREDVDSHGAALCQGGCVKIAEAFNKLASNFNAKPVGRVTEKRAEKTVKTSDDVWNEGFGLKTN